MIALLLILTWVSQGIPALPAQTGTITGPLKTDAGTPAVGVRVGAMVRPESAAENNAALALASLAETDAAGHFRLENLPQGRYYITAGRVDFPTYFPGTQMMTAGTPLLIKPGETITGIDFAMNSAAVRPPDVANGISITPTLSLPVNINIAGGGAVPVYAAKGFASLQVGRTSDGSVQLFPLASSISVPIPTVATAPPEYRITIQNLPDGYTVVSMLLGTTPVTNATVKFGSSSAAGSLWPALTIGLSAPVLTSASAGVRVTGKAPTSAFRSVYLNGVPGIFFADGSFEFRGVQPGRYTIATPDNPLSSRPLAAAVVVGQEDVSGVELSATPLLPLNIKTPVPPAPVGTHAPGTTVPLAVVSGLVLDEATHQPIPEGTVYLSGHYGSSRSLVPDGRFEFTRLLPGSYALEVQTPGHGVIKKTIVVDEDDVTLEFSAAALMDR